MWKLFLGGGWIYVAVFLAGGIFPSWVGYEWHKSTVAEYALRESQTALAAEKGRAEALSQGLAIVKSMQDLIAAQNSQLSTTLNLIPAQLAQFDRSLVTLMKATTNDPKYDCRRLPLPDAYLDGLRRPAPGGTDGSVSRGP